jgi:hypothetical protein
MFWKKEDTKVQFQKIFNEFLNLFENQKSSSKEKRKNLELDCSFEKTQSLFVFLKKTIFLWFLLNEEKKP